MINLPIIHIPIPLIYVQLILAVILLVAFIIFSFIVSVLLLDEVYRKDAKQYPKHIIWDTITPLILLITPSVLVLSITHEKISLIDKFFFITCLHSFIVIPLMQFWSTHRKWDLIDSIKLWTDPIFFKYLAIALLYPLLWGVYFSLVRYLRLGTEISYKQMWVPLHLLDYFYLIPFILLHLIPWIYLFVFYFKKVRENFWYAFTIILYSFHFHLLRYTWYFLIAENLYKVSFIIYNTIALTAPLNLYFPRHSFNRLRRLFHYIYFYPIIIFAVCLLIPFCELLVLKKLSYGFYALFYGPLALSILNSFKIYGDTSFVIDVCKSDYLLKRFGNLRYPLSFWVLVQNPYMFFGFEITLSDKELTYCQAFCEHSLFKSSKLDSRYRSRLLLRVSGLEYNKINKTYKIQPCYIRRPWKTRLKAAYFKEYGVRWYHTTRVLYYPGVETATPLLHAITKKLCKTPYDYLALIDTNIKFFEIEQLVNLVGFTNDHNDFFVYHPNILIASKSKRLTPLIEAAQAMAHKPLAEKGVISGSIDKMRNAFPKSDFPSMQSNPDVAHSFSRSSFLFKNQIGTDFKNIMGKTSYSNRNQVSIGTYLTYDFLFDEFTRMFAKKHPSLIKDLQPFFEELKDYAKNDQWDKQLILWADHLHRFPQRWAPPLSTKKNLPLEAFKPEVQIKILDARKHLEWLSKKAHELEISETSSSQQDVITLENEASNYVLTPAEAASHLAEVLRVD